MSTNNCPACGAPVAPNLSECKYCGEAFAVSQPQTTYAYAQNSAAAPSHNTVEININNVNNAFPASNFNKSKVVAGILGILLGGFGIHKFYLGRIGWGIVYLVLCWTYIPAIVGFIEGIIYLASSEESFRRKHERA